MTAEQRRIKGQAAEQLLSNDLFIESLASVENDVLEQLRHAHINDKEGHTNLVIALQVTRAVQHQIWLAVQDGINATEELNMRGRRID